MFRGAIPLGRVAGIAVGAHWSVLIAVLLFAQILAIQVLPETAPGIARGWYWVAAVGIALCLMGSLLAHELAHALLARHYGITVERITLWLLGGAAQLEREPPTARADFLIALVGPATSAGLGGVFWAAAAVGDPALPRLLVAGLLWLAVVNIALGVFNLLPGTPLDGGRVLRAAVWKVTGDRARAARVAARGGQVLGTVLVGLGIAEILLLRQLGGLWLALVGWFLTTAAQTELAGERVRTLLGDLPVSAIMTREPVVAPGWWTVRAFLDRTARTARRRVFPVVSFEGAPIGVVNLGELAKLTPDQRMTTTVAAACRMPPSVTIADAGTPVVDVLKTVALRPGRDLLLVREGSALAGVMSAGDLSRTLELAALADAAPTPRAGAGDR
ncbi:site-2 protease family protein [Prauserella flavalba]|uniref:Zinc metalloprotease n=1 Tax=Prauserella flavalba TaxID=1477506 RepID=A0A318LPP6_9PSEU|nr:site-2 protease family protein [Prauserella flavalba]PXY36526.1 peptidase [Prauserella flavalba]